MWLRKQWLMRALQNYPLYDPPHKIEERLMPREQAFENFLYFMDVRKQRVEHFRTWLRQRFWTPVQANERGVKALNSWRFDIPRFYFLLIPMASPISPTIRLGWVTARDATCCSTWVSHSGSS